MADHFRHILKKVYTSAVLVAECKAMPHHMLVCFESKKADEMQSAIEHFEAKYDTPLEVTELDSGGHFKGFWLPQKLFLLNPVTNQVMMSPNETDEYKFLKSQANLGSITYIQNAEDAKDLNEKLVPALKRAHIATNFPSRN